MPPSSTATREALALAIALRDWRLVAGARYRQPDHWAASCRRHAAALEDLLDDLPPNYGDGAVQWARFTMAH